MKPSEAIRKGLENKDIGEHFAYYLRRLDKVSREVTQLTTIYAACALGFMWVGSGNVVDATTYYPGIKDDMAKCFPELTKHSVLYYDDGTVACEGTLIDLITHLHLHVGMSANNIADWLEKEHQL